MPRQQIPTQVHQQIMDPPQIQQQSEKNIGNEFDGGTKEKSIGNDDPVIINNSGKYPSQQHSVLTF